MYTQLVKLVTIDLVEFVSIILGILFYYFKMMPFVSAAVTLGYVNGQTLSYALFAILLVVLPCALLLHFTRVNKGSVLRYIFYAYAVVILTGTGFDVAKYNWFIDYSYIEGDAIFVNLMWNIPGLAGVIVSIIVAVLYFLLGKQIKRTRTYSYLLYIAIFIMSHLPAYVYSLVTTGGLPRNTFLQKNLYVFAVQVLVLIALSIAASSRSVWKKHVWQ